MINKNKINKNKTLFFSKTKSFVVVFTYEWMKISFSVLELHVKQHS